MRNILSLSLLFALLSGCADMNLQNMNLKNMGSSILSGSGLVNQKQADGVFEAGNKLVKSQEELTSEQEYYLGRAVSAKILEKYVPNFDPGLTAYVNRVGHVVAGVSDTPETFAGYHFIVVNSPQVNAMSAPSGFIFVTSGFLRLLSNEDQLAALLAHEVAHVVKQHGVNAISNANLFSALSTFTEAGISVAASQVSAPVDLSSITNVFSESVSGVVDKLLTSGFDKSQEYDADEYALQLLVKAGYDGNALKETLKILDAYAKKAGHENSGWFSTHPEPEDRIDEIDDSDITVPAVEAQMMAARTKRFGQEVRL